MNSYIVSFELVTGLADLAEVSSKLGMSPGPSSHEKSRDVRTDEPTPTIWKLVSEAPKDAHLEEHLDSVFAQLAGLDFSRLAKLPSDSDMYLNVAVFTYSPMGSVVIPRRFLGLMNDIPMDLITSCYFCEEEES